MSSNPIFSVVSAIVLCVTVTPAALAAKWNTDSHNVVLNGYDVVAYRTMDKAVLGSAAYVAKYDGVEFHFSTPANLAAFQKDPARYVPQYHGFCAFAVGANDAKVPANPKTFKLYNGKLLVFFNDLWKGKQFNTKIPWNANEQALYAKAEQNWKTLEHTK